MEQVTDPNVLAQLNAPEAAAPEPATPKPVTDPALLAQLNAPDPTAEGARTAAARHVRAPRAMAVPQYGREPPSQALEGPGPVLHRVLNEGNRSLGNLLTAPLDIIPSYYSENTGQGVWRPARDAWDRAFVRDLGPPTSKAQEYADAGGKMIGEAAPFSLLGGGLLPKVTKAAVDATPSVANAIRNALAGAGETMVKKPLSTIAGENVAAGESGAAGEVMRQKAEDGGKSPAVRNMYESFGQLLGPTALQAAPGALMLRAAKPVTSVVRRAGEVGLKTVADAIPDAVRPSWLDAMAERGAQERLHSAKAGVAERLGPALDSPESKAALAEAETVKQRIPGFAPGVARETGDPVLMNAQKKLDTEATGENLRRKQEQFDANSAAIKDKYETVIPAAGENPQDAAVAAAKTRVTKIGEKVEGQADATRAELRGQAESLPQVDRIEGGGVLREARGKAQKVVDAETTRLRKNIADPNLKIEVEPAVPATATEAEKPAVIMTVDQLLNHRAQINQTMRDYTDATSRSVDDVRSMRKLSAKRDRIDELLGEVNDDGLKEYTRHYREENVPLFRQGASAEVGQRDQFGYGGNRVDPEKVGRKFFNPNEESAARQFMASMGKDPAAKQQMVDNALDDLRHTSVDPTTGMLREGSVAKWLKKNERVLNEVPFVREAIAAKDPDALYGRLSDLKTRQGKVADSKLATVLERVAGPGQAPENAIHAALNDHTLMKQVVNSVRGDEAGERAVRRAVFDAVRKDAPDALTKPDTFVKWLDGHRRPLAQAFTPEHLADLRAIAKASEIQSRVGRPTGTVSVPRSIVGTIEDAIGVTASSAASTARGVAQGRTSLPIEAVAQGSKFLKRKTEAASSAAWEEALSNPEAARHIATIIRGGKATKAQITKLHSYIPASITRDEDD